MFSGRRLGSTGRLGWYAFLIGVWASSAGLAAEATSLEELRREVAELTQKLGPEQAEKVLPARIDTVLDSHEFCGPAPVRTKAGTLRIGGLLQVWAYSIQNDTHGFTDMGQVFAGPTGAAARNEEADNDSLRIRRAEVRFDLDIHANISLHLMLDPAREATAFPAFPDNQASRTSGDQSVVTFDPCLCAGFIDDPRQIGAGSGEANRLLQDAYLSVHDWIPHHELSVGQLKRHLGLEGPQDSGTLDFVERAMVAQPGDLRDLGLQIHGSWLDDRIQYWVGLFDGAGSAFQARANRSDDNDEKDLLLSVQFSPLRDDPTFGSLDLGFGVLAGTGGEAGGHQPGTNPVDGLNRRRTARLMEQAWASYRLGGPLRGWWIRGEWGRQRDRLAPEESATGLDVVSFDPAPVQVEGWYVSTGYHLGRGGACERLPHALQNLEFLFRYEAMQNVLFHSLTQPERRFDLFKTQVLTAGINYYLKGNNAKIQLNYNWVVEDDDKDQDDRQLREVRNDSLVLGLQVAF